MAKHRKSKSRDRAHNAAKRRRTMPAVAVLGTTAGLSTALVFGHATGTTPDSPQVALAASVATIGIGGRGDTTSANIEAKISGELTDGTDYYGIPYPAGYDIDNSVAAGVPVLQDEIGDLTTAPAPVYGHVTVIGYSEGTIVAENVKRNLATEGDAPSPAQLSFIMIASPNVPNGGIFSRFPDLQIPFIVTSTGAAQPSDYSTTYITNEYDPYADFPAYFNVLSLANTIAAVEYVHPDAYYDPDSIAPGTPGVIETTPAGSNTTYYFVTADHLPLLAPLRQLSAAVGLTAFTDPVLNGIEPILRVGVDMGYTDRDDSDPGAVVQFSLITPPDKIIEAVGELPGAIEEGANNFVTGVEAIPGSVSPLTTTPSPLLAPAKTPSITPTLAPQEEPKLPITTTPPKLPSVLSNPLGISPLSSPSSPKVKPGSGFQKLAQAGKLGTPVGAKKVPGFKHTPKGEGSSNAA